MGPAAVRERFAFYFDCFPVEVEVKYAGSLLVDGLMLLLGGRRIRTDRR